MTDGMLLHGLLDPSTPLPGDIVLRPDLSEKAAQELCDVFDLRPIELAERVYRIAIANMAQAVRRVSVQRGFDPRDYALLPCGGAGPLIAAALAAARAAGLMSGSKSSMSAAWSGAPRRSVPSGVRARRRSVPSVCVRKPCIAFRRA